jgi:predicted methyltransferase
MRNISPECLKALRIIEQMRPDSLRQYDQIPMLGHDLLCQVQLLAPYMAGRAVAFIGDHDGASTLIGLLSSMAQLPRPARIVMLDFDERLLIAARGVAAHNGFGDYFETYLYNVFDRLPRKLGGQFDWLYTNPPYGSRNVGESARLFLARGFELVRQREHVGGCIILPDDHARRWTRSAMQKTQSFLCSHGWKIDEKVNRLHRYHLDDNRSLASSTMIISRDAKFQYGSFSTNYSGRRVMFGEIPNFYGRNVLPPYPRYIRAGGQLDFSWSKESAIMDSVSN